MPSTKSASRGAWEVGSSPWLRSLQSTVHTIDSFQTLNVHLNGFNQELEGWLCEHHNFRTPLSPQSNLSLPLLTCLPIGAPVLFMEAALRYCSDILSLRNWSRSALSKGTKWGDKSRWIQVSVPMSPLLEDLKPFRPFTSWI